MRCILTLLLSCFCAHIALSQQTTGAPIVAPNATLSIALPVITACRVLDPELQTRYEGPCSGDGWAHGIGKATGERAAYEGRFVFGAKQGVGVKTWLDTGDRYAGDFFQDARQGAGTYTWGDDSSAKGSRYVGQFQNDLRHGQGSFYWGTGDAVHGQWEWGKQLAPATPMQTLQILHLQAMAKTIAVGQRVCQGGFAQPAAGQVRGTTVSLDGNSVSVRLHPHFVTQNASSASVITTLASAWWPC
jgi:hypothetical protein